MNDLKSKGFLLDNDISSRNNKVFYNKEENRVVIATAGTHSFSDAVTDLQMGVFGYDNPLGLKRTKRYKESQDTVSRVREKYKNTDKVFVGHSLGGTIASQLAQENKGSKAITYNRFFHPLYEGKPKKNVIGIANYGDPLYKMWRYKADYVIPSRSNNPLTNHSLNQLDKNLNMESILS